MRVSGLTFAAVSACTHHTPLYGVTSHQSLPDVCEAANVAVLCDRG